MNKRIEALKHQATLWCDDNIPEKFSEETGGYGGAWEDKFAELIVAECVEIAYEYDAPKMSGPGMIIAGRIEQHFGVE